MWFILEFSLGVLAKRLVSPSSTFSSSPEPESKFWLPRFTKATVAEKP
jgi:hypothetical protein